MRGSRSGAPSAVRFSLVRFSLSPLLALLLALLLSVHCSTVLASRSIESTPARAGFSFDDSGAKPDPVVEFRQHVSMLANVDDRLSMQVYGDGRVLVHYPVYMKRAGDYEMQLDGDELVELIATLADDGVMDFDHRKVSDRIHDRRLEKISRAKRGEDQLFAVSDAVDSIIEIRLDEYRSNSGSAVKKNFTRRFKWRDIEHDARSYSDETDIVRANRSVQNLRGMMKDARLQRRQGASAGVAVP